MEPSTLLREQPWHQRRIFHFHQRWHEDLLWIHRLTLEWLSEAKLDKPSHVLGVSAPADVRQSIQALEAVTETALENQDSLESLLDDTHPDDLLGRLENSVITLQAWTLTTLNERSPELLDAIEQASWRQGRSYSEARLKDETNTPAVRDARRTFAWFIDPPFFGRPRGNAILVRRATQGEVDFELRSCPHRSANPTVRRCADVLCRMYAAWMKGLIYGYDPQIHLDYQPSMNPTDRCRMKIQLPANSTGTFSSITRPGETR